MSKAAELIAGLQTDAKFDSAGSFSLDRDKAREKMRQFQLADPHRYVLLLIEAAALRGATRLDFEIDTDDMRLQFDAALSWEDLEELYSSLFVDRSSVEIRARRELALACNAVMALNPRWVRLESFAMGEDNQLRGVSAVLRPDAPDEITQLDTPVNPPNDMPPPWTTIHVKERFRPGLLVRFFHDLTDAIPEELLIRERCTFSSRPITLDRELVSRGLPEGLVAGVAFELDNLRGVAGLNPDSLNAERSAMVLVSNGVEIVTHELSDSIPGLWFWIDSSRLRKDVSQADVVRGDPSYEQLMPAIGNARDHVLRRLVQMWSAGQFTTQTAPTANAVFDLIRDCFVRWGDARWLQADAGPLSLVADMPIWRTVDRRWLSPRALAAAADPELGVMYTDGKFDGVTPLGWGPVIHVLDGADECAAIQRIYAQASSVTAKLRREVPWELNRRQWLTRVHPIELPHGTLRHPVSFEQGELSGCVALRPGQLSSIRVVVQGCLLTELELDLGFVGVCAVITGPFEPVREYTHPQHDRAYATALLLLLAQLPVLIQHWANDRDGSDVVKRCVLAITRPVFAFEWLVACGFKEQPARQLIEHLAPKRLMPELGLGVLAGEGQAPTAVARSIHFVTIDARRVSLADIDHERRGRAREPGKVLIVDHSMIGTDLVEELVVHADAEDRRLLVAVFGAAAVHDDTKAFVTERNRRRFLAKPQRFAGPPTTAFTSWTTRVELPGDERVGKISGFVGIGAAQASDWVASTPRRVGIEVLTEDRVLCMLDERSWLPGAAAVLAWERAPVNQQWDGLKGSKQPLLDAVETGLVQIIQSIALAADQQRPDDDTRRLLWRAMVSPFVSAEHAGAWRALRAHHAGDHPAAVQAYFEVMLLLPGIPLPELREAISMLLTVCTVPTREEIVALTKHPAKLSRDVPGREFHRQLLESYALLELVPMVVLTSGKYVNLATLNAQFERTGEIAYVEDRSLRWDDEERMIVRADDIDHVALIRLFGREQLTEVSGWIHERQHQQRFESRARLEHIRVADHQRLVGVEINRDDFVGELVIPRWSAGEAGSMTITLCHDHRVVQDLEIDGGLPVIGIVEDPRAELGADYASVDPTSARMAALRLALSEVMSRQLLPALAERYDSTSFDEAERELARSWIYTHWRRHSPGGGDHPNRLSVAGKQFAKLELFQDCDGGVCTLEQLSERNRVQGCLWYVEHHPGHSVPPPFPILLVRGRELAALGELFGALEDFSARWRDVVEGARRRSAAAELPPLPITPPQHALVSAELERYDMQGVVWLPDSYPFDRGVRMGCDGKVVEIQRPNELLPIQGIIGGALRVDDRFEHVELSNPQQRYLDARVITLYKNLLDRRRRELARPDIVDFASPELARQRAVALDMLRAAAVSLGQARVRGVGFDAILGNLDRALAEEPLLRLATGTLISMTVARRVRPRELAHLKIWDPDQPVVQPVVERVVEPVEPVEPVGDDGKSLYELMFGASSSEADVFEFSASDLEIIQGELGVAPVPEPEPEPAPEPEPDYVGELLERVRGELRLLRERHQIRLSEGLLDCIDAESGGGRALVRIDDRVIFDCEHPRFVRALEDPDPIWVSFLASVAYTGLNRWLEEVTDDDELAFHARHAQLLLTGQLGESLVVPTRGFDSGADL